MEGFDNNSHWYVMQVMSGQENKVFANIRFVCSTEDPGNVVPPEEGSSRNEKYHVVFKGLVKGIYEVSIPYVLEEERNKKDNKKIIRERKLYPGYVLLRTCIYDGNGKLIPENWSFIKDMKGVIGFIGGTTPVPLSEKEVAEMMRREKDNEEEKVVPRIDYHIGESVRIKDGAFENQVGIIENIDEKSNMLSLSLSMFGRSTTVQISVESVEQVEPS